MAAPWENDPVVTAPKPPFGPIVPGNINLNNRPVVPNGNGYSTVRTAGFNLGGRETNLPTVSQDGRLLSNDQAIEEYRRTGQHLGQYGTPMAAGAYAQQLHEDQAQQYGTPWEQDEPVQPQGVPHTGFRGQQRVMREREPQRSDPMTMQQIGRAYADIGRGAAIGVPVGIAGLPGDAIGLANILTERAGVHIPRTMNTQEMGDYIAGPAENDYEAAGRLGGSMIGPGGIAKGVKAMRGAGAARAASAAVPTTDELRAVGTAAYKRADQAGVVVSQQSFKGFVDNLKTTLANEGVDAGMHPKAIAALNYLEGRAGENITLKGLDIARQNIARAAKSPDAGERHFAMQMKEALDDYLETVSSQPGHVIMGDAQAGVGALNEARDAWARMRKSELVDDMVSRAELSASKYTQSGFENAIRNEVRTLVKNKNKMRGFSEEERAALERVVKGGPVDNVLRWLGKFKPTGAVSAIPSVMAEGAMPGAGFMLAGVGAGARAGATAGTVRNLEKASEVMRRGGAATGTPQALQAPLTPNLLSPAVLAALLTYRGNQ